MTTIGWVVFGLVCLVIAAACALLITKKKTKILVSVIAVVVAAALCVGAYFGAKAIFSEKTEEPVIEEQVEEVTEEAPANE